MIMSKKTASQFSLVSIFQRVTEQIIMTVTITASQLYQPIRSVSTNQNI